MAHTSFRATLVAFIWRVASSAFGWIHWRERHEIKNMSENFKSDWKQTNFHPRPEYFLS